MNWIHEAPRLFQLPTPALCTTSHQCSAWAGHEKTVLAYDVNASGGSVPDGAVHL
jgi:hypothetical protein